MHCRQRQVGLPGLVRDFSPRVNFLRRLLQGFTAPPPPLHAQSNASKSIPMLKIPSIGNHIGVWTPENTARTRSTLKDGMWLPKWQTVTEIHLSQKNGCITSIKWGMLKTNTPAKTHVIKPQVNISFSIHDARHPSTCPWFLLANTKLSQKCWVSVHHTGPLCRIVQLQISCLEDLVLLFIHVHVHLFKDLHQSVDVHEQGHSTIVHPPS